MHAHRCAVALSVSYVLAFQCGCMTMKESDTARTGIEQLLISSATDRALDKIDFAPIARAKVYLETKYLDCVDKNYVLVSLHQRLLAHGCALVEKAEEADVVLEVGSGGVGTDRTEWFVGIPEIPLPPPSPIAIPKLAFFSRTRAMGTAKLNVIAYDVKNKQPVINTGYALARSDHKNWNVMGMGGVQTGSVPQELATATGETESLMVRPSAIARRPTSMR
ncbi:MAG: hypothetical protein HYX69_07485 [Planctomycetia bacterium]|nr:hypothetical protein [Planctomycetia bacterium]